MEAKRPGQLAWHRAGIEAALTQAWKYAYEQKVRTVAISDGHMLHAADRTSGDPRDRLFVDPTSQAPSRDLWWISVYGIYQHRDDLAGAALRLLPEAPPDPPGESGASDAGEMLHPKHRLPARWLAYVGDPAKPSTWKLPYLIATREVDLKRLPMAIGAVIKTHRGARASIPEAAVPDVLVRLARAAKAAGRFDAVPRGNRQDVYEMLAAVLDQLDRLSEV